jgi:cadmium resistance protein CadD (predicted permease)
MIGTSRNPDDLLDRSDSLLATNVDDLFLPTLWFVERSGFATVLRGQLAGFSAILLVSLVGYLGLRLLSGSAVHWLGLAPIAIGIKQLVSAVDTATRVR